MACVKHLATVLAVLFGAAAAFAQVPPGVPYNPQRHPNPVVTFIRNQDFKVSTYDSARKHAGFDPLGLSEKEGKRLSVALADPMPVTQKIDLPNNDYPQIKVQFYPVVRQTYQLTSGGTLTLDTFKFPKVPLPMNQMTGILNDAAFLPGDKFWKARFGNATTPEQTMVRGVAALLFDDNNEIVLFWREGEICYAVKSNTPRQKLILLLDDLL